MADAKPTKHAYYGGLALAVAARADCAGLSVGAVIVKDDRVVSTGYNGTPSGVVNCTDGGCTRCTDREKFPSGTAYDLCICVHAEANALAAAARFGSSVDGAVMYTTHQPCFSCSKNLIQAGISQVFYIKEWPPKPDVAADYMTLQTRLSAKALPDKPAKPLKL